MAISIEQNPIERVLGKDFTLDSLTFFSEEQQRTYYNDRLSRVALGETVWIVRNLDSFSGFAADLRRGHETVATLSHEYGDLSDVYITTGDKSVFGNETLCGDVPFEEAVRAAENYASGLPE